MRLGMLTIKNFKGIESLIIDLGGKNASVFGANASGKSTIADAVNWLFFGKDSLNQANFEIKPVGKSGVDVSVEAVIDEPTMSLAKVYKEMWTKKRGSAKAEFTGHSTDHFVNGVPAKKKEFDEAVSSICKEDLFRLLTNPRYFNESLHWQDRRKMLLAACGDVPDTEVIESDESLGKLVTILGKRSIDDHKKVLKARMPEINRELHDLPVRIDEIAKSAEKTRDILTVKSVLAVQRDIRKEKADKLSQLQNGGSVAIKAKELAEVDAQIISLENKAAKARRDAEDAIAKERRKLEAEVNKWANVDRMTENRKAMASNVESMSKRISGLDDTLVTLRGEWKAENSRQFEHDDRLTCPTCGQGLPADKVEAAREAALAAFNADKAARLKNNQSKGKATKEQQDKLKAQQAEELAKIEQLDKDIEAMRAGHAEAVKALNVFDDQHSVKAESAKAPELIPLQQKRAAIAAELEAAKTGAQADTSGLMEEIDALDAKIEGLQKEILAIENKSKADQRVEELKTQERKLSKEYEKLEGELNLIEKFIRAKVSMLDERINGKFTLARFKMFDEQINGGLAECCDCTVNGVPYNSMNNAARINAGIDICNVLSAHFGVSLPMIIDNAESVTDLMPSNSQQIRLVVSGEDEIMRIVKELEN